MRILGCCGWCWSVWGDDRAAGTRLGGYALNGKQQVILYLGDWDPSGKDIERDLVCRLLADAEAEIEVRRVAIFQRAAAERA